jgi:hypothetical protein
MELTGVLWNVILYHEYSVGYADVANICVSFNTILIHLGEKKYVGFQFPDPT